MENVQWPCSTWGLRFKQRCLRNLHPVLTWFFPTRLPLGQSKPSWRAPVLGWSTIYETFQCHEVICMSALREKPDLSITGSDLFNLNFLTREEEGSETAQKEP